MSALSTEALCEELFTQAMQSDGSDFTITKVIGIAVTCRNQNDTPLPVKQLSPELEINAAAVRGLGERFPSLNISYPATVLSEEKTEEHDGKYNIMTKTRTDAVIHVPASFSESHCGISFQKILQSDWKQQLAELTAQIAKRLRKHEMKTARLFGKDPAAGAVTFRVTAETVESEIWAVTLESCGFYPLQWEGEVCGMAKLLSDHLPEPLAPDCKEILAVKAKRLPEQQAYAVTVYYSMKQD